MFARMRLVSVLLTASACLLGAGCQTEGLQLSKAKQDPAPVPAKDTVQVEASSEGPPAKIEARTYLAAARLHESQNRPLQALQQYQYALAEDPQNVQILLKIGLIQDQLGNGAAAERAYRDALRHQPDNAQVLNNLAFSYILRQRWKEAEVELARALEISPDFARARINLAVVFAQQNQFEDALRQFQMVLPLEEAYYNQGLMYQSKRKSVEAAAAYKRALEANPRLVAAEEQLKRMSADVLEAADRRLQEEREAADRLAAMTPDPVAEPTPACTSQPAAQARESAMIRTAGEPWIDDYIRGMLADVPEWVVTFREAAIRSFSPGPEAEGDRNADEPEDVIGHTGAQPVVPAPDTGLPSREMVAGYQPLFSLAPSFAADLDTLFPPWQQSSGLMLELERNPFVLFLEEDAGAGFDWQASPWPDLIAEPLSSVDELPVSASAQPD